MSQETFPPLKEEGPIRPHLKDSSVIIKPKILLEAPVLEPLMIWAQLFLSVFFPISGKIDENPISAPESFRHLPSALKSLLRFLQASCCYVVAT